MRPAPALPPAVQAQWERAQWVLYLLRRRVRRVSRCIFCKDLASTLAHMLTGSARHHQAPAEILGMRMMAGCCGPFGWKATGSASQHESVTEECSIEHMQRCCSLGCPAGRT